MNQKHPLHTCVTVLLFATLVLLPPSSSAGSDVPSYQEARDAFLKQRADDPETARYSESDSAVMQQAEENLARTLPDPGIKAGEKAPDFILPNAFGEPLRLSDQLREGPVVLVFYRGAWCPFCNLHLRTLYRSLPEFARYGARLILVTPQQPDKSREQLEKTGYPFEVLSDLDSSVMKSYNLYFELEPDLVEVYNRLGLDIVEFNGPGRNVLPVPGTFIIDRGGVVRAMHADIDYKERMEPAAILDALAQLRD
jgi:peroxiredoxin